MKLATPLRLAGCLALAVVVYGLVPDEGMLATGLAIFTLIGSLWLTQALHLSVTALLVPLLAALTGLMSLRDALASFANPIIFLFLGGFALAAALQQQGIDRALALAVLRMASGNRLAAVLLLFCLTAFLSMWISNTATAAMVLPLAIGMLTGAPGELTIGTRERVFVLLGVAYSASIGGIGTLIGSPPNAIAAAQAGIDFAQWLKIGIPMVVLLLPLMVGVLYAVTRPQLSGRLAIVPEPFEWTPGRKLTVLIFALTATGWIAAAPLGRALGITADMDSIVAIAALVALVASGALEWEGVERHTHWGVLLLFGGGLALSRVMDVSGATRFLADAMLGSLEGAAVLLLLLAVVAFVVFLTELVSNTAAAALLIPLFLGVGSALGLSPTLLASAIAVSASCAFMLPVATPPNALVFATGQVPQAQMMRCGLVLNAVCIAVITVVATAAFG